MSRTEQWLAAGLIVATCGVARAQEGANDASFNVADLGNGLGDGASADVSEMVIQADGKIIIVGNLYSFNGVPRYSVARLNTDGTLDPGFTPGGTNQNVTCCALQGDGKLFIGGHFAVWNGVTCNGICRLNSNGTIDNSFTSSAGTGFSVTSIIVQPDGRIIVAGSFSTYAGVARKCIARLNADGTLDSTFDPGTGPNMNIEHAALQPNGRILVCGDFTTFNGVSRNRIARLLSNGALDGSFSIGTGANSVIYSLALQPDRKVVIGGAFTSYNGTGRNRVARLDANGSVDNTFDPLAGANGSVSALCLQPDGKILIGGSFTLYGGTAHNRVCRLQTSGALDSTFDPGSGADRSVFAIAALIDGHVIVAGDFGHYNGYGHNRIVRVTAGGALDPTFNPNSGANGTVYDIRVQQDGKILVSGDFTNFNGVTRNGIARLLQDGSVDPTFAPNGGPSSSVPSSVSTCAVQPDGKIVIGGSFDSVNGVAIPVIARLNTDGSLDNTFNPGINGLYGSASNVTLQPDGKILLAGNFYYLANGSWVGDYVRLNTNGTLDSGFLNGVVPAPGYVSSSVVLPDGDIIIGGNFSSYNGTPCNDLARLNSDGTLDVTLNTGSGVNGGLACTAQPDGKLLLSGSFNTYNGIPANDIVRVNLDGNMDNTFSSGTGAVDDIWDIAIQPDGKIIVVGYFTQFNGTLRNHIARLNANGTLDTTFDPGSGPNKGLQTVAIQPDGKVLAGGYFTSYNGSGRDHIVRTSGTPRASIRTMLEGPYTGGNMTDALRFLPSFPLTEPFTAMGYAETGYVGGATIGSSVLTTTGNNAIVDWVLVEMRPVAAPGTVAASRAVLLQRDGDVVDLDGVSTVGFAGLAAGNYCVAVKPRNHLPVMLSATTPVSYGAAIATVDFTLLTTQVYDNDARKNVSGVMVLAAGDVSFNETIRYTGSSNDRDPILIRVGSTTPNNSVSGYWREDVNMDGVVKYTGSANDRDIILTNVGSTTPNNTRVATLP